MDAIERKSWVLSLVIHVTLVLVSLFGFGIPVLALRASATSMPPAPAATQRGGEVVLAPEAASNAGLAGLSALPPLSGQPAPSASVIVPASTSFAGKERSRGDKAGRSAPVQLPQASMPSTPLSDSLRGQHSNPKLSSDAANRATSADHVDFQVKAYFARLHGYTTQITNRSLVIEVITDGRGIIRRATMFHCSTGVPELDRAICDWLVKQETSVPSAEQTLRLAIVLP